MKYSISKSFSEKKEEEKYLFFLIANLKNKTISFNRFETPEESQKYNVIITIKEND